MQIKPAKQLPVRHTKRVMIHMLLGIGLVVLVLSLFAISQLLYIRFIPSTPAVHPKITSPLQTGSGPRLRYAVMGDSTGASIGSQYTSGIAYLTAEHLAQTYTVEQINTSVSGATTETMRRGQTQKVVEFNPDLVLMSIGANDITHFHAVKAARENVEETINAILQKNCSAKIVITGAPAMDTVRRFALPTRWLAGFQTKRFNTMFQDLSNQNHITMAPLAEKTRPALQKDASLFASDRFHPSASGYLLWSSVLNPAIDTALQSQPSHCDTRHD